MNKKQQKRTLLLLEAGDKLSVQEVADLYEELTGRKLTPQELEEAENEQLLHQYLHRIRKQLGKR